MSDSNDSTDAFLQIAQRTQEAQEGLIEPQPVPMSGDQSFELKAGGESVCVPSVPKDDVWFDSELARLRETWAPFLANHAPAIESIRTRTELKEFDWRVENQASPTRLPDALAGAGEWEAITIPHYGGPIGKATAFYRTVVELPQLADGQRQWIHFEGVDYIAKVYLNGNYIGQHEGLFAPFEFDVTDYVLPDGENVLLVQVENDAIMMGNDMYDSKDAGDKIYAATGPGWDDPNMGWHHCPPGMGIYRKAYFETRSDVFIEDGWVRPLFEKSAIELCLEIQSKHVCAEDLVATVQVFGRNFEGAVLSKSDYPLTGKAGVGRTYYRLQIRFDDARLWTPETPWLYALHVSIGSDAQEFVFGMRDFRIEEDEEPKGRLYLNGEAIKLRGTNTMGHEQLCVMAGDDEQLLDDMLIYKMAGMNYIRFTQRPVEREVYALCDALGLMAQVDLPMFKNVRRNQFNEAVRQTSEMERFARRHPSIVIASFINEPFPLHWHHALHRHLGKDELNAFFKSATIAILQENPDRAIKPIDGDYDPPSPGLPDNHCYTLWYNGHAIPYGKLEAGYWTSIKPGWNFACGEYGAEGLDPVDLMRRRYPQEWLPQNDDEDKVWTPSSIRKAQSGDMYQVFYDRPETLQGWVNASQDFQAWVASSMTETFRRDPRMVSFAIHLGIDAFPSGWMKTIVDCERRPKKAFFTFRDALAPVLPSLRAPRRFWWSDETFEAELWISNDLRSAQSGLELRVEMRQGEALVASSVSELAEIAACDSVGAGKLSLDFPEVRGRANCRLTMQVVAPDGSLLGESNFDFDVFERVEVVKEWKPEPELTDGLIERAKAGETIVCGPLSEGTHQVGGLEFEIAPIGMGKLNFCSRATGHPLVDGFEPNDFRLWFDENVGHASCTAENVIRGEGWEPILMAGAAAAGFGSKWTPTPVVAEHKIGDGRLIVSQVHFDGRIEKNPPAAIFASRLMEL